MTDGKVLDFVGKKKENTERKRRSFERLLFQNFLGAYSLLEDSGSLVPITLVDISREGCLFKVPCGRNETGKRKVGEELTLRMYFTKDEYIPAIVTIKRGTDLIERDGLRYMQYGCSFDKSISSFDALESFIEFLYKFSQVSCIDKGDSKAYFG